MFPKREQFFRRVGTFHLLQRVMKVVGIGRLHAFQKANGKARSQLEALVREITAANWRSRRDVEVRFGGAVFVSSERVVFHIVSGEFRLDAKINYQGQIVLIVRLGTSAEAESWSF